MKGKYVVGLLVLIALTVPLNSYAASVIELTLTSGASTVTITDNGVNDSCGSTGCITYIGAVGAWNINVTTGLGSGQLSLPQLLHLNSIDTTGMASTLTISFTEYNIMTPFTGQVFSSAGGAQSTGTSSFAAYYDSTNKKYGTGTPLGSLGPFSGSSYSGNSALTSAMFTGTYSLTEIATLIATGADTKSFDYYLAIPEPATLSVLGAALLGLGTGIRRKLTQG